MEENKFVTKAKLTQGKSFVEDVETEEGTFQLRQLTYGERGKAFSLMTGGLLGKGNIKGLHVQEMEGDGSTFVNNLYDYNAYIISCAMSLDKPDAEGFTPEDIKNSTLKDDTIEFLADHIELSNGFKEAKKTITPFCKNKTGNETNPTNPDGQDKPISECRDTNQSSS